MAVQGSLAFTKTFKASILWIKMKMKTAVPSYFPRLFFIPVENLRFEKLNMFQILVLNKIAASPDRSLFSPAAKRVKNSTVSWMHRESI